jgi:hypothetical protein
MLIRYRFSNLMVSAIKMRTNALQILGYMVSELWLKLPHCPFVPHRARTSAVAYLCRAAQLAWLHSIMGVPLESSP